MNAFALLLLLVASIGLLLLPRRWAPMPLLAGACYVTLGQGIEIAGINLHIVRLLLLVGIARVIVRGERPTGGLIGMDWLMFVWSLWALLVSPFREEPSVTFIFHAGMVFNTCGVYFLIRAFCQDEEDAIRLIKMTAILLVPVALEMVQEQLTGRNLFAVFGGVPEETVVRRDRLRSQGPFAHAILAGTVGAVCAPFMAGIWRRHPWIARIGLGACVAMVLSSASSGPLMSLLLGGFALVLWRWRHLTRQMRIAAVTGYLLLELVMNAPAYYLIARIDLAGGSTGFHRARLIQSAFTHLGEWWFAGTDYTRHWMPFGVPFSPNHADITNHYLAQGVRGGLPLMLLFIGVVWCGFHYVGQALRARGDRPKAEQFLVWSLGASLFAHATTCISVAYFDQSFLFLYLTLGMIVSLRALARPALAPLPAADEYATTPWDGSPAGSPIFPQR